MDKCFGGLTCFGVLLLALYHGSAGYARMCMLEGVHQWPLVLLLMLPYESTFCEASNRLRLSACH